jgi:hypothetical protein
VALCDVGVKVGVRKACAGLDPNRGVAEPHARLTEAASQFKLFSNAQTSTSTATWAKNVQKESARVYLGMRIMSTPIGHPSRLRDRIQKEALLCYDSNILR